jgi:nucleotide-binding universal stress UspA family protein
MKTILAPTDFSSSSINAVNYAADMAVDIQAQLVLLNAVPFPISSPEIPLPASIMDDLIELGNNEFENLVEDLKIRTKNKISISSEIIVGSVERQIELVSMQKKPLAIVMGIKPGKSFERALMGSSIFHTINHVPYPLMIIPENIRYSKIREIGLACDLEEVEESLPFESIKEWLSLFKPKFNVIYVTIHNKAFKSSQLTGSVYLQNHLQSFHPVFHFLDGPNLSEELNDFAKSHNLDLLMVIPKGHGISRLFQHKHSRKVITHNNIPVLALSNN